MKRLGLALAFVLVAGPALAGEKQAQEQFEEGRALVRDGRPEDAISKFLASLAEQPSVAALLNLADCYERIGKLASAHARFLEAQELAKTKGSPSADEAKKRAALLEPRLATVTLLPPSKADGVRVWVDGVEAPQSSWGTPRAYDAGSHEIVTTNASGKRARATLDVPTNAARLTFPIEVEPTAAPPRVVPPPSVTKADPPPSGDTQRVVGLVVGGAGIATIGVGVASGIVALGAKSDLDSACASYPQCPASRRDELVDTDARARTFGTLSTVTLIAGVVLVAMGAAIHLTAPSRAPARGALPLRDAVLRW